MFEDAWKQSVFETFWTANPYCGRATWKVVEGTLLAQDERAWCSDRQTFSYHVSVGQLLRTN